MPVLVTNLVLWALKLSVVGLIIYIAYWIALMVGALVVLRLIGRSPGSLGEGQSGSVADDEWRNGHSGYGRYVNGFFVDEP